MISVWWNFEQDISSYNHFTYQLELWNIVNCEIFSRMYTSFKSKYFGLYSRVKAIFQRNKARLHASSIIRNKVTNLEKSDFSFHPPYRPDLSLSDCNMFRFISIIIPFIFIIILYYYYSFYIIRTFLRLMIWNKLLKHLCFQIERLASK